MADDEGIGQGLAALRACQWAQAEEHFRRALTIENSAEAFDGLGRALYWQGRYPEALRFREQAFAGFEAAGDHVRAGAIATRLAMLHGLIYGNGAAVSGWLGHASRLLDDAEERAEHGWLRLFLALIAQDPADREEHARAAMAIAERHGDSGLRYDAMAYVGKSLVERGGIEDGMALIDQAVAAVSGDLFDDIWAAGEIYCVLFHACEMVTDVQRAASWLGAVDHYVERTRELPIAGICRMHYGGLLTAAGRWEDAERELTAAREIYQEGYTGSRFEADLRLADLRVRQGRLEEAEALVEGHEERPTAALSMARLHLARGRTGPAAGVLERHLVKRGRGVLSADCLALLVEVAVIDDEPARAAAIADELNELAAAVDSAGLAGLAAMAEGRVAAAKGDDSAAARSFRAAVEAFTEAGRIMDVGSARLGLARALTQADSEDAGAEADMALAIFDKVGARAAADEAASLLRALGRPGRAAPRLQGPLTRRESEVLELVAAGLTNRQIAERLYISHRTVEDHVSKILRRLGATNRTEAARLAKNMRPSGAKPEPA